MNQISVVIPAVQYDSNLETCLSSLVGQKDIKFEVIVVFNPTRPAQDLGQWPAWIKFSESKKGVNAARNMGLQLSSSENVLFLDSDCVLQDPYHIQKLLQLLNQNPAAAGVGGGYEITENSTLPSKAYHFLQMEWLRQQLVSENFRSRSLIGGHMLLRKAAIAGFIFDEKIIFGGSEKEFFIRLSKAEKHFVLDLNLTVLHLTNISRNELLNKAKAQGTGEKYIHSVHGKFAKSELEYVYRLNPDSGILGLVEEYREVFSKYSGQHRTEVNPAKKFIYSMIEHLTVSQSSKD